jgi:tetratricopeptide (TPR) repeat protein
MFVPADRLPEAEIKMTEKDLDAQIGAAWSAHYEGQDDAAIQQFTQILNTEPANIDANWGLGLAYRSLSQHDRAREIFLKVKELIQEEIGRENSAQPGRFVMLNRMVDQQLASLEEYLT